MAKKYLVSIDQITEWSPEGTGIELTEEVAKAIFGETILRTVEEEGSCLLPGAIVFHQAIEKALVLNNLTVEGLVLLINCKMTAGPAIDEDVVKLAMKGSRLPIRIYQHIFEALSLDLLKALAGELVDGS